MRDVWVSVKSDGVYEGCVGECEVRVMECMRGVWVSIYLHT